MIKVVFFATIVALSLAAPKPDSPPAYEYPAPPPPPPVYKEPGMPFEFAYAVKDDYSGNNFAHDEKSDGDVTSGSYRVLLPDGRTQIVTFTADHHNGYVAQVTYEGEATYPAPAPYHPPPPPAPYHPPPPAPLYKPAPASPEEA
ncbi:cuticle protein 7-like [Oratosquilla oratoria]|uniref:cuticle protein 7-like n=1 Tax=Oratosquilla oratoria TaxID=337810 RepID=UPI003F768D69